MRHALLSTNNVPYGIEQTQLTVLILEDKERDATLIDIKLGKSRRYPNMIRCHVPTVESAMATLERQKFDLIFADLSVLNGIGLNVVSRLKIVAPDTPIVVVTGSPHSEAFAESLDDHVHGLLYKDGLTTRMLDNAIRDAIMLPKYNEALAEIAALKSKPPSKWREFGRSFMELLMKVISWIPSK